MFSTGKPIGGYKPPRLQLTDMIKMNVVEKMNGIFDNVMQNNQEWCTDHLLEIINEILHMASEVKKKQ